MVSSTSITLALLLLHGNEVDISYVYGDGSLNDLTNTPSFKQCQATPRLISSDLVFIPFPLQIQFKAHSTCPANSCTKILFPLRQVYPVGLSPVDLSSKPFHDQKPQNSVGLKPGICLYNFPVSPLNSGPPQTNLPQFYC